VRVEAAGICLRYPRRRQRDPPITIT